MRARKKDAAALQRPTNLKSLVPAPTAVPAAAGKQQNEKDNYEKRRGIHVRLPRNAAYCAAWNSGFMTTFSWSSGSRKARGEMVHSDALTSVCLLSLKRSVSSFWLCAVDFRLPRPVTALLFVVGKSLIGLYLGARRRVRSTAQRVR
jgi:hypothetical protein